MGTYAAGKVAGPLDEHLALPAKLSSNVTSLLISRGNMISVSTVTDRSASQYELLTLLVLLAIDQMI